MKSNVEVRLWGKTIGSVHRPPEQAFAYFQYSDDFARGGVEVSPLVMPLAPRVYRFPNLSTETFHGLNGLLADSLPDKFGNAVIDQWLATQGRTPESFDALERLCYIGTRGMGALEFRPESGPAPWAVKIEIDALVELASQILQARQHFETTFDGRPEETLRDILQVGTSAGGARAKAVIAWNRSTGEVRSGQVSSDEGFEYWLLKFDGVAENKDKELADPKGYGVIEYAYSEMAKAAGITMGDCHLMEENGRRHFMTRRFDRLDDGRKLHMQSLCALAHYDYNDPNGYSYEQAFLAIRRLDLGMDAIEEQFRRMAFNIVARNQDDHVKNIAFLMDKGGRWSLSPAFDVTWNFNPSGQWTRRHQMSMNGKREGFELEDFRDCGKTVGMKRGRAEAILEQVRTAVVRWPEFAREAGVERKRIEAIAETHRLSWGA